MSFDWDPKKSKANAEKHKISFEAAAHLWNDPHRLVFSARTLTEQRFILIATLNGRVWTAVFTFRSGLVRLISVRRSRKIEKVAYEKKISDSTTRH